MTAQVAETLINNNEVDFGDYALYSVCVGDPEDSRNLKEYPFKQKADSEKFMLNTACWRGYVSAYELMPSGKLRLIRFEYSIGHNPDDYDEVDEVLEGDFWLDLRTGFFGAKMLVPFENSQIVTDRSKWRL